MPRLSGFIRVFALAPFAAALSSYAEPEAPAPSVVVAPAPSCAIVLEPAAGAIVAAPAVPASASWRDANRNGRMDPYEDPALPVERRVADLLSRMSRADKLGQLNQRLMSSDAIERYRADLMRGDLGAVLPDAPVANDPLLRNCLQRIACEESPHGIPLMMGFDTIHGFRTVFPIPLAQACAWEPELTGRTSAIAARESAAAGVDWIFAPMCDIARDARWGRVAEGFGEDPWLVSRYVAASVKGFQGERPGDPARVVACLKHFVGYGAAEAGRDYNTVEISPRTMRDVYLPPFRAGVEAGVRTLMCAFHSNNGVPLAADRELMTGVLRREWGFDGLMVSVWTAVSELIPHGYAYDAADAARFALLAGVDMEMVSACYADMLPRLLAEGGVPEASVDEAVRRILRVKFERGLFDRPYADETLVADAFLRPDAVTLARESVRKSCVLVKRSPGSLPLEASKIGKLALIGPLAEASDEMLGTWQGQGRAHEVVNLADALRGALGAEKVVVARGCPLIETVKTRTKTDGSVVIVGDAESGSAREIADAVSVARSADVVVMALGEPRGWSGENASRTELSLTGRQQALFEAVAETGKPVVVVLFSGRPLAVPVVQERAAAVLLAWHPGVQAGPGITDLLLGVAEPTGRLAMTWPRSAGQCPLYYNHANTGRPQYTDYKDAPSSPLYAFGFGLGYADFDYSPTHVSSRAIAGDETVTVSAHIRNTSQRAGETVAQLYIRCLGDRVGVRPVRELRDFRRLRLEPGEARRVTFEVPASAFARLGAVNGSSASPEGPYRVWISADSRSGQFAEVFVGESRPTQAGGESAR